MLCRAFHRVHQFLVQQVDVLSGDSNALAQAEAIKAPE